jgi:hypothetical protein
MASADASSCATAAAVVSTGVPWGRQVVRLDGREEGEEHAAAAHQAHCEHQGGHASGHGEVAPGQRALEERLVDLRGETLQGRPEERLDAFPTALERVGGWAFGVLSSVSQVGGQHELGLDEREDQACDHDLTHGPEDLAHGAGHHEHGRERGHRRQHSEDDRHGHALCTDDGALQAVAQALLVGVDVLADDHRVVHEDAEHHDEREQRDDIDRQAEWDEHPEAAEERDRHTEGHPEGDARP